MTTPGLDIAAALVELRRLLYRAHSAGLTDAYDTEAEFNKRAMAQSSEIVAAFDALGAENKRLKRLLRKIGNHQWEAAP